MTVGGTRPLDTSAVKTNRPRVVMCRAGRTLFLSAAPFLSHTVGVADLRSIEPEDVSSILDPDVGCCAMVRVDRGRDRWVCRLSGWWRLQCVSTTRYSGRDVESIDRRKDGLAGHSPYYMVDHPVIWHEVLFASD